MAGPTSSERTVDYLPLHEIVRAPRNPKGHDTDGIRTSISAFGLADLPVIDERTGRLVSGHGRLDDLTARAEKGEDPPDGVRLGRDGVWLVPVIRGWASRSDQDAEAYLLYANQATIKGGWDDRSLLAVLTDLAAADANLPLLAGFTEAEMAALAEVKPEGRDAPDEFPSYDETIPTEHECPACGYTWSGGTGGGGAD